MNPNLLRSRLAARWSPCALRNSRCVTPAGGTRIIFKGTGRTFDGRRVARFGPVGVASAVRFIGDAPQLPNERAEVQAGLLEGRDPVGHARWRQRGEVDQLHLRRQSL